MGQTDPGGRNYTGEYKNIFIFLIRPKTRPSLLSEEERDEKGYHFTEKSLKAIEKAILNSDIGITPTNDGKVLRLVFPQLTEERRKDLCKSIKKYGEECKVAVRNVRREAMDKMKAKKKDGELTEDDMKSGEKDVQKLTDKYCDKVDQHVSDKEKEIMSI